MMRQPKMETHFSNDEEDRIDAMDFRSYESSKNSQLFAYLDVWREIAHDMMYPCVFDINDFDAPTKFLDNKPITSYRDLNKFIAAHKPLLLRCYSECSIDLTFLQFAALAKRCTRDPMGCICGRFAF